MKFPFLNNSFFLLILLSSIWGSAFLSIKISVETLDPITVTSGRLIIGSIVLFIFFKIKKISFNPDFKTICLILLIGFIGNLVPFFLISWSEQFLKSNTTGLLMSVGPIFALIFSHFMTKDEKFTIIKFFTVIIGLIGVLFIFDINSIDRLLDKSEIYILPKFLVLIAVLGYVLSSILAYNIKKIDILALTTFVTISAAIMSLPFMIYVELNSNTEPSVNSLISLVYLGCFPTAIAFLLRFHIISISGPIFLSYVSYLIPGFAIIWGFLILNEQVNPNSLLGLLFILLSVYLSQRFSKTTKEY